MTIVTNSLSTSQFVVKMIPVGVISLFLMEIIYIAVDRAFPHHINSFDSVDVFVNGSANVYHSSSLRIEFEYLF